MTECTFCQTALPAGAAFCASCGRSQRDVQASSAPQQQPDRPLINPEAQRAYTATAQAAQGLVSTLGIEKTLGLVGGALAVLGCLMPMFYVNGLPPQGQASLPMIGPLNLLRVGAPGIVILLLSLFLGLAPFIFRASRAMAISGVGLCAIVLSLLIGYWIVVAGAHSAIQTAYLTEAALNPSGYNAADPMASVGFGPGIGFYSLLIGYAVLFYAYTRTADA